MIFETLKMVYGCSSVGQLGGLWENNVFRDMQGWEEVLEQKPKMRYGNQI